MASEQGDSRFQPKLRTCLLAAWIAVLISVGPASAQEEPSEEPIEESTEEGGTWAEVREAYGKAKRKAQSMGETLPDKLPDWMVEDLKNVGAWQYRVVETDVDELEAILNQLGQERWECFAVETTRGKSRMVFKRRKRSRLRELQDLSPDDLLTIMKLIKERRLETE